MKIINNIIRIVNEEYPKKPPKNKKEYITDTLTKDLLEGERSAVERLFIVTIESDEELKKISQLHTFEFDTDIIKKVLRIEEGIIHKKNENTNNEIVAKYLEERIRINTILYNNTMHTYIVDDTMYNNLVIQGIILQIYKFHYENLFV